MNATAVSESLAEKWRLHCQQHPHRFRGLSGNKAARMRAESLEERWIEQLHRAEASAFAKAVAFRSIVELRKASGRDVATFFDVDPQIVVLGLSLLELPDDQQHPTPAAVGVDGSSRTLAA